MDKGHYYSVICRVVGADQLCVENLASHFLDQGQPRPCLLVMFDCQ